VFHHQQAANAAGPPRCQVLAPGEVDRAGTASIAVGDDGDKKLS